MPKSDYSSNREVWEDIYASGHKQLYPWDLVVSFVFRNAPKDRAREKVCILELGFGTGSNLWFAAREGFSVSGVEGIQSAVEATRTRFRQEGLSGDLRVGDFTDLPFEDNSFDLIIDRGSLVCVGHQAQKRTISEVQRCLKDGGRFLYNGYADSHSSMRGGEYGEDGLTVNIKSGSLVGVGALHFVSRAEIDELFSTGWKLMQVQRKETIDMLSPSGEIHAEWIVVAEKVS